MICCFAGKNSRKYRLEILQITCLLFILFATAKGRLQCSACAKDFQNIPITHAFSSEFPRAQETLRILLQPHPHVAHRIDPRLNEWRTGMDGKSLDFFHAQMDLGVSLPETFGDIVVRIQHFIDDAKSLGEGSNILVVSHKITIVAAMVAVEQLPREA